MKKITNIGAGVVVTLVMVIAALVYISPRFGYRADNVATGSMEPAIMTNSMVVAQKVDVATLQVNDIITYKPAGVDTPVCHRIIAVQSTFPISFTTKGDALANPDSMPVSDGNVMGKVTFNVPYLGLFIQFLRSKIGLVVGLIIPALVVFWFIFRILWQELVKYIRKGTPSAN